MISKGPKSRAFYRVQATRRLVGGGDIVRKRLEREHDKAVDVLVHEQERQARQHTCRVFFDPAHYTVLESVGLFDVMVGRDGGPDGLTVMVDYYTEDGTANAGSDYQPVKGTLTFHPTDKHQANLEGGESGRRGVDQRRVHFLITYDQFESVDQRGEAPFDQTRSSTSID